MAQLQTENARHKDELRVLKMNETKQENRRLKAISQEISAASLFTPADHSTLASAMQHPKLGLVPAVQYWADGSPLKRDQLIMKLITQMKCRCVPLSLGNGFATDTSLLTGIQSHRPYALGSAQLKHTLWTG